MFGAFLGIDRAKCGWKWLVATDRWGVQLGRVIDDGNRNDSVLLERTLQAVADHGLLLDVQNLHLTAATTAT